MNETLIQLQKEVADLKAWKTQKERQQISYPLDIQSIPALAKYLLRYYDFPIGGAINKLVGLGNTAIDDTFIPTVGNRIYRTAITVGQETFDNQGNNESSKNTQTILENDDDSATLYSFYYGYRKPLYLPRNGTTVTVSSAGNTLTDSQKAWTTNELAGAHVNIYDSTGALKFTRQIASNTATVVTIDGTWPATVTGGTYVIFMPIFLGSADYPWRQLYTGGTDVSAGGDGSVRRAIRVGFGSSSGEGNIGVFYGTGSPESVVTANIGSLFLRLDGTAGATLYVKQSGTSNTGWSAGLSSSMLWGKVTVTKNVTTTITNASITSSSVIVATGASWTGQNMIAAVCGTGSATMAYTDGQATQDVNYMIIF